MVDLPAIGSLVAKLASSNRTAVQREQPMERKATNLTCPQCRGPLDEERQGKIVEYRCRVGHSYTPLAMEDDHRDTVERSLWSAIVALEETADIADCSPPSLDLGLWRKRTLNARRRKF